VAGNVVGTAVDQKQAKDRAQIAAQLGRPVARGSANPGEVIAMTRAGVAPELIVNYIHSSGMVQPITAQDVIYLHQQGVPDEVIQAMQAPPGPPAPVAAVPVAPAPSPVVVEEYRPYYDPFWHPYYGCCRPQVGVGVSFSR
jgi:hypothetical protein